ncbi:MAG TPA: RDD family protein [Casimicrobiaceae bacterium]|nr:RDD family protein [Casimicrobiaceae bacterium]
MTQPPASLPARPEAPLDASLPRRLGALLYEALLLTAIEFIVGFLTLPLVSPSPRGAGPELIVPNHTARAFLFVAMVGVAGAYLIHGWTRGRRTLPQKTWRMRLIGPDGEPPHLHRALLRYIAAFVGPLLALVGYLLLRRAGLGAFALWLVGFNYLWALVDPDRRFLHDRIAQTRLIRSP